MPLERYQDSIRDLYDGPAGAMLALSSLVSLHEPLMGHLIRSKRFDVTRFRDILDVGSGAGQILGHLLREAVPQARLVGIDLSHEMLVRARNRLKSRRPLLVSGNLLQMPFADNAFDCITCGWVLEHLPEPDPGLREFGRVLRPGGTLLLLATEDTLQGSLVSRTWKCRTFRRRELEDACGDAGLKWERELWLSRIHRLLKIGGILVEATHQSS